MEESRQDLTSQTDLEPNQITGNLLGAPVQKQDRGRAAVTVNVASEDLKSPQWHPSALVPLYALLASGNRVALKQQADILQLQDVKWDQRHSTTGLISGLSGT